MNLKKPAIIILLTIVLLSFIIGIYFYQSMPEVMASHWNMNGLVDGYTSKAVALFIMPVISIIIFAIYLVIPALEPLKKNLDKFQRYFDCFIIIILLFLLYLYILTILWNLGILFNMNRFIAPAFAAIFFYAGVLISKTKRNWFIGIRTPWTLSSDSVWNKTHKLGGALFKICGLFALLGVIFYKAAIFLILVPVLLSTIIVIVYSYKLFRIEKNKK